MKIIRELSLNGLKVKFGLVTKNQPKGNLQASQVKREDGSPEDYDNWTVMTNLLDAEKK